MSTPKEERIVLTAEVLRKRLDQGLALLGGARGSLTKSITQLHNNTTTDDLELLRIEMTKRVLIYHRNQKEIQRLRAATQEKKTMDDDSTATLEDLRRECQQAQHVSLCLSEYEALAKVIVDKHVVSEHALQLELKEIQRQTKEVTEKVAQTKAESHVRATQFHALQQCLHDLQHSLTEPLEMSEEEIAAHAGDSQQQELGVAKMEVDDEEEGELYGDLDNEL